MKLGYFIAQQINESNSFGHWCGFSPGLRKMWSLKLHSKIKIHLGPVFFNALPVRTNLVRRGIKVDLYFPKCTTHPEILHMLFGIVPCSTHLDSFWPVIHSFSRGSCRNLFCYVTEHGQRVQLNLLLCFAEVYGFLVTTWLSMVNMSRTRRQ